jgi:hypothetical protein
MAKPLSLDKVVAELVKLEQGSLPDAKDTVGKASALKSSLKERLVGGEAFPENTKYFARLREKKGRASYKRVIGKFLEENPEYKDKLRDLADDDKDEHPGYKVEYGAKQLDLFKEN